jgi:hypothetical protein
MIKSAAHRRRGYCAKLGDFGLSRMLEAAQVCFMGLACHALIEKDFSGANNQEQFTSREFEVSVRETQCGCLRYLRYMPV